MKYLFFVLVVLAVLAGVMHIWMMKTPLSDAFYLRGRCAALFGGVFLIILYSLGIWLILFQ